MRRSRRGRRFADVTAALEHLPDDGRLLVMVVDLPSQHQTASLVNGSVSNTPEEWGRVLASTLATIAHHERWSEEDQEHALRALEERVRAKPEIVTPGEADG